MTRSKITIVALAMTALLHPLQSRAEAFTMTAEGAAPQPTWIADMSAVADLYTEATRAVRARQKFAHLKDVEIRDVSAATTYGLRSDIARPFAASLSLLEVVTTAVLAFIALVALFIPMTLLINHLDRKRFPRPEG